MIEVEVIGAAQTVTGSKHVVRTSRANVLLECGLYQGRRRESIARSKSFPIDVPAIDATVLSHAHIDHSGALPLLYKNGYRGSIYATPATRDLCAPMLQDAAAIQRSDARHIQRQIDRRGVDMDPVEPLYLQEHVVGVLEHMVGIPYHRRQVIAPGITLTFLEAGHVLGSAVVVLDIEEDGATTRLAFTGDLGRAELPILRKPEVPTGVHCLISESTYGDRLHEPLEETSSALAAVVRRTFERGGKVIIPSFALERAQEVIYQLKLLRASGQIPLMPVYVDSPLTVKLTDVFRLHPECYDRETYELFRRGNSPFEFDGLKYISDKADSMQIDRSDEPCIIISASGMCEGGRVLHHLRATVEDRANTIVIVGFQAQHTLGRRIVEKRSEVKIFGLMRRLDAEVVVLNGFSAHADQAELLAFAEGVRDQGKLRQVILVHGEPRPQRVLTDLLKERGFPTVYAPESGTRIRI